jgi:Uncharacterized protein conserved in bacteria
MTAMEKFLEIPLRLPGLVGSTIRYSGETNRSGGSAGSGSGNLFFFGGAAQPGVSVLTVVVALIFLALIVYNFRRSHRAPLDGGRPFEAIPPQRDDEISRAIGEHDPDFSRERFLLWAERVFIQLQQAWTDRDWRKARPFESEELFSLHRSQLDSYIRSGTINIMGNVCVVESFFCDYAKEDEFEFLTVFMNACYNDYVVREDTKKVVRGDPERTYQVRYKLRFMRASGVATTGMSNGSTERCPNCGAPADINEAGQCACCGTVVTNGACDWVLCGLDEIP